MAEFTRAFQWCNGGHYFPLESPNCADSGYSDPGVRARLVEAIRLGNRFEELIAAGVSERDLLCLILCPDGVPVTDLVTPCGGGTALQLAKLVSERNALLLRAFPDGILQDQLQEDAARPVDVAAGGAVPLPCTVTDDLQVAIDRAEAFRRETFPLIPAAHLDFLGLFDR
jgi:hypothetical protein